eukprot:1144353-Pelagomonas_calceolata.AAC.6
MVHVPFPVQMPQGTQNAAALPVSNLVYNDNVKREFRFINQHVLAVILFFPVHAHKQVYTIKSKTTLKGTSASFLPRHISQTPPF